MPKPPAKSNTNNHAPHIVHPAGIVVYTDGACQGNPGPAGLGAVLLYNDQICELSEYLGHGTNNIAELTAILRAIDAALNVIEPAPQTSTVSTPPTPPLAIPVTIYTDSTYAIGILTKDWQAKANTELVAHIRTRLRQLIRHTRVSLKYVRGHSGIPLNEAADQLARQAITNKHNTGWCASTHHASNRAAQ